MIWFLFLQIVCAQNPVDVYRNNSALDLLHSDKRYEAKQKLQGEVLQNPTVPFFKYNFGKVLETSKEIEDAIREYSSVARQTENEELKFQALFNVAKLYSDKQDISNSLKFYQMALDIRPDSKEVKTNIELLLQNQDGGGGGEGQDKSEDQNSGDKKEDENQGDSDKNKKEDKPKEYEQPKPQKFKSQDLSEQDVKKILEELKRQEDQIRKKLNEQQTQESPVGKDW